MKTKSKTGGLPPSFEPGEEMFRLILENTPTSVAVHVGGVLVYVNPSTQRLLGATDPSQIIGRSVMDFVHPSFQEVVKKRISLEAQGQVAPFIEEHFVRLDGSEVEVEVFATPLSWEGGMASLVLGRDISDARSAMRRMEVLQGHLARSQVIAKLGSFEWRVEPEGMYWSEESFRIFGYQPGELVPSLSHFLSRVHPEDRGRAEAEAWKALAQRETLHSEYRLLMPGGQVKWIRAMGEVRLDEKGHPVMEGAVQDVTAEMEAQQARRRLEEQVFRAQKLESLGVMAGGVAHDFNNMLVSILGETELMLMDLPEGSPLIGPLRQVEKTALQASGLTKQMLAFSGRGSLAMEPLSLTRKVEEMAAFLRTVVSKKANLMFELAPDLPTILADGSQMDQVVMNLVLNGSEALGERAGDITVATGLVHLPSGPLAGGLLDEPAEKGDYVFLEVRDTGRGMDSQTRARIFEPFYTTKATGRGLGLAAVLGVLRGHKAQMVLTSEPEKGAVFRVLFAKDGRAAQEQPAKTATPRHRFGGQVLVVEDEPSVQEVNRRILARMGLEVLQALDGQQGVELFTQHGPNLRLLLLDLTMPKLSGQEVLKLIDPLGYDVPVLVVSGYSHQQVDGLRFGGRPVDFLKKPYLPADLTAKVAHLLQEKEKAKG